MKRKIFLYIISLLVLSSGCKKFLEEKSQDEVRPSTVGDLVSLMSAEGYPYQSKISILLNMLTDDVQCYGGQGQALFLPVAKRGRSVYTWSKEMFQELGFSDGLTSTADLNSWQILYQKIAGCNVVLDHLDIVSGPAAAKENLRGQALSMRAFYYLHLVNMFARPYNQTGADPATSPGVPLKLTMEVTDSFYMRNSVKEVYTQIENDLKQGVALMEANPQENGIYKMTPAGAYSLLSRMYLYMENWDLAIENANKAIALKQGLTQLSSFKGSAPGYYTYNAGSTNQIYNPLVSKEIIFSYSIGAGESEFFKNTISPGYNNTLSPPYAPSAQLMSLYESRPQSDTAIYLADLRPRIYIVYSAFFTSTGIAFKPYNGSLGGNGIRLAEMYLNRAEAKIRKFMAGGNDALRLDALSDINTLRISRYDPRRPYVPVTFTDGTALLNFYKDERRRELPFEGHRWYDLRRYGMPSITHFYEEDPGTGQTFTLAQGDSRYTLQIPRDALNRNPALTQNQ